MASLTKNYCLLIALCLAFIALSTIILAEYAEKKYLLVDLEEKETLFDSAKDEMSMESFTGITEPPNLDDDPEEDIEETEDDFELPKLVNLGIFVYQNTNSTIVCSS